MADTASPQWPHLRVVAIVFVALFAMLATLYFVFLRQDYAVLYQGLREQDAAAIVTELQHQHVPYKLAEHGATILVPASKLDAVRLDVAGSNVQLRGLDGFELFNQSDMGLTEFAQKVRYQRALQGELARTIMMVDGVEEARVHISIPERSLFRGQGEEPKAAVTLITRDKSAETPERIAGIQRLVSAAVTDMTVADVVVLNGHGEIISSGTDQSDDVTASDPAATPLIPLARQVLPGRRIDLSIRIVPPTPPPQTSIEQTATAQPQAAALTRRVLRFATEMALSGEEQARIREALEGATIGDGVTVSAVTFLILPPAPPIQTARTLQAPPQPEAEPLPAPAPRPPVAASLYWIFGAVGVVGAALLAVLLRLRPAPPLLSIEDRRRFADHLKLAMQTEAQGGEG